MEAFSTRQVIVLVLHQATVTLLFSFTAVFSVKALITLQKNPFAPPTTQANLATS